MTTGGSNDENESVSSDEQFAQFMKSLGAGRVKRMGTAQEVASVCSAFLSNVIS